MILRTLVSKLREAKIVSAQTKIEVITTKENGKIDYKGTCISIDASLITVYLLRQCEVVDFAVSTDYNIVQLYVRISEIDYINALNELMQDYLYKSTHDMTLTEFEKQYGKMVMIGLDNLLHD